MCTKEGLPIEVQSCVNIKFENPPNEVRSFLRQFRLYKRTRFLLTTQSEQVHKIHIILEDGNGALDYSFPRSLGTHETELEEMSPRRRRQN